jgi:hypothetical protein
MLSLVSVMYLSHYPYVHVEVMVTLTAAIAALSFVDSLLLHSPLPGGKQLAAVHT